MKHISLLLLFTLASCQDYNSNSGDRAKYGPITLSGDSKLDAATAVLQSRCISCHDRYHDNWADLKTNADWITEGLVVAGDVAGSRLIQRTVNTGATDSNMPPGRPPLPNDEYKTLTDWVTGITP